MVTGVLVLTAKCSNTSSAPDIRTPCPDRMTGAFGLLDQFHRPLQIRFRRMGRRLVTGQLHFFGIDELRLLDLRVLADIDQHRARASTAGDVECLATTSAISSARVTR